MQTICFAQNAEEIKKTINSNWFQIYDYVDRHNNYSEQLKLIEKFKNDSNINIRKNYFKWNIAICIKDSSYRKETLKLLLDGLTDKSESVSKNCYASLCNRFNKRYYDSTDLNKVKFLVLKQIDSYNLKNKYFSAKEKREKDSLLILFNSNQCYYNLIQLAGYLGITELRPDLEKVLDNYNYSLFRYNKKKKNEIACEPCAFSPIEVFHESSVISPWDIHIAFAQMGDKKELEFCFNKLNEFISNKYTEQLDFCIFSFIKGFSYTMQPETVDYLLILFNLIPNDDDYKNFMSDCFRNMIKDFPRFSNKDYTFENITDWIVKNKPKMIILKDNAFRWPEF